MTSIELYRRKQGLNQTELGELIGVTTQTISNYETQKNDPTTRRYKQLAEALGLDDWTVLTKEV